jgi:predicted NAD/FAD-binding protein
VSGLAAAWLLARRWSVVLYEAASRPGGHANTVDVVTRDGPVAVDTGFIVYNEATYPNLTALLAHLGVATAPSRMTFSVSLDDGASEYNGNDLWGLAGSPRAFLDPSHWRMVADIFRFFREGPRLMGPEGEGMTLGEHLARAGYSRSFIARHILPMGAAIWSCPRERLLAFPAATFARFFANHGLLRVRGRPQWRTIAGGSRSYVRRLVAEMGEGVLRASSPVRSIRRLPGQVVVEDQGGKRESFEHVLIATHADEALRLLDDADGLERELLGAFSYSRNSAVLHRDPRLMPRRRRLWSSWNYLGRGGADGGALCVSYWMNSLQPLATGEDIFVTLNPATPPQRQLIEGRYAYSHPVLDGRAIEAQRRLWELQGRRRTWFAGAHFGYGFHEDALQSGLRAAEEMGGVKRPWRVADENGRILATRPARVFPAAEAA